MFMLNSLDSTVTTTNILLYYFQNLCCKIHSTDLHTVKEPFTSLAVLLMTESNQCHSDSCSLFLINLHFFILLL